MRVAVQDGPLSVLAVAGTDVVLIGIDLAQNRSGDLLGFAIRRTDHTENHTGWLKNLLAFKENDDGRNSGYSSLTNPIQAFRWGDYTTKPGHDYSYLVRAIAGAPGALTVGAELTVRIRTEGLDHDIHQVVFNRGAIASQAYAQRFGNRQPADVPGGAAYTWLSGGLLEAMLAFIGRATGPEWAVRAAVYEFTHPPVLAAFAAAAASGADVRIVSDTVGPDGHEPRTSNAIAIAAAGIEALMVPRTHIAIAHNKFIVLSRNGDPVAVWTGSTNVTEGGLFGQSNVGHAVADPAPAARFLDYWNQLAANPLLRNLKPWTDLRPTVPVQPLPDGTTAVFSPRSSVAALQWYADLADRASSGLFLTAAFGISPQLLTVLTTDRDYLKYVLMDTDTGGTRLTIRDSDPDNQVTVGAEIGSGGWGQWVREVTLEVNKHVRFVHTKFMLIDPLGSDPVVIAGSANFSQASTISNDENMLVIRGQTRVADIYLTEFMRLFTHYEFRASIARAPSQATGTGVGLTRGRRYLNPTSQWTHRWYVAGSSREKERRFFAGTAG